MRTLTRGLSFLAVMALIGGCCSKATKPADKASAAPVAAGDVKPFVLQSAGIPVLQVIAPADARCAAADGSLKFAAKGYEVQVWLVPNGHTVDDATGKVAGLIADEFKDFTARTTTDLTVAGAPAKELVGTGHEADDGDDGSADLVVFKVGDHVFVACNHGEQLAPEGHAGLLAIAQSAKLP